MLISVGRQGVGFGLLLSFTALPRPQHGAAGDRLDGCGDSVADSAHWGNFHLDNTMLFLADLRSDPGDLQIVTLCVQVQWCNLERLW